MAEMDYDYASPFNFRQGNFLVSAADKKQSVIVIGDSMDGGGDTTGFYGGSWGSSLAVFSNQKFNYVDNKGVGGQTTTQIANRLYTDVLSKKPGIVVIGGSTNDRNGGTMTLAQTQSNFIRMVSQARSEGVIPVVRTAPPTDIAGGGAFNTIALNRQGVNDFNNWLRMWARVNSVPVIDLHKYWVDPATGGWLAGYTGDGVHPNGTALTTAVNALVAGDLPSVFKGSVDLAVDNSDTSNVANALCIAGTPPTSWYFPDPAVITTSAATFGKWVEVNPVGASKVAYSPALNVSVGDVVAVAGKIKMTAGVGTTIQIQDQTYTTKATPLSNWTVVCNDGTFYMEYTVVAGITQVWLAITSGAATGKISVSQLTFRNKTKLGLA